MAKKIIDTAEWDRFVAENTESLDMSDHYDRGFADGLGVAEMFIDPLPISDEPRWIPVTERMPETAGMSVPVVAVKAAADDPRVIEIVRAGVVQLPDCDRAFAVNGKRIEEYIRGEVEKRRPVRDQYGNFAGKVTIRLEILGDMEVK